MEALVPDTARAVRSGEELPTARLQEFLQARLPGLEPLSIEQFPSGYSNLTYLLKAGDQELVLRRPPFGADAKGGHDMGREFRVLSALHPLWPKAPRPLVECSDDSVIGAPFYVMERVRGAILRGGRGTSGPELDREAARSASLALIDALCELHALDCKAPSLAGLGRPEGYAARQVKGWAERYQRARSDELPELERVVAWLHEHVPPSARSALIHNDYKFDNVVFDLHEPARIVAVLDWEMATLGDPLLDLGTTLAYWTDRDDPADWRKFGLVSLTLQPGCLDRLQVVERYAARSGWTAEPSEVVFAYAYGLFKVAVIAQQIYARFQRGHTRDPRFAGLGLVVRACGQVGLRAIELGRIDRLG